jgi:hypothetical protein
MATALTAITPATKQAAINARIGFLLVAASRI